MKIYTKKGDLGTTSIIGENNVNKNNIRIEAYGTVDELNSYLGLFSSCINKKIEKNKQQIVFIQNCLFKIGASLASTKEITKIKNKEINFLEISIDEMEQDLPVLKSFILPGGEYWSSCAQICRSICRRAERRISALNLTHKVDPNIIKFMNRLSDYLFVLARYINFINNISEIKWKNTE
tara:strand:- start:148 stop:687 length:540 start_codon:yes stop_codon:yes gene_type:complete